MIDTLTNKILDRMKSKSQDHSVNREMLEAFKAEKAKSTSKKIKVVNFRMKLSCGCGDGYSDAYAVYDESYSAIMNSYIAGGIDDTDLATLKDTTEIRFFKGTYSAGDPYGGYEL